MFDWDGVETALRIQGLTAGNNPTIISDDGTQVVVAVFGRMGLSPQGTRTLTSNKVGNWEVSK